MKTEKGGLGRARNAGQIPDWWSGVPAEEKAVTRWVHVRARTHRTQPDGEGSDQFGFVSEVGQFRKVRAAAAKQPPRKLTVLTSLNQTCGKC